MNYYELKQLLNHAKALKFNTAGELERLFKKYNKTTKNDKLNFLNALYCHDLTKNDILED